MGISISRWIGAGLLAFGVVIAPTAFISSAGVAYADTEADSEGSKPASPDSPGPQESGSPDPAEPDDEATAPDDQPAEEPEAEPDSGAKKPTLRTVERVRDDAPTPGGLADHASEEDEPVEEAAESERSAETTRPVGRRVARTAVAQVTAANSRVTVAEAPEAATAAAQPAPTAVAATARPNLINIVGTLFFNLFDRVVEFFEGPPVVPPGRAVRLGRAPLELDCGNGYTVDADWYFPTETTPDKVIYFQHGAFGRAGLYNITASDLAVRNNAIVVAPSITTNFFACDGCTLAADQMHAAVADLFIGDRAALVASAVAAGWDAPLPQRFVIAGHSGGGQLAAGAAGYYAIRASADEVYDLAGVLLLDTSVLGGAVERGVGRIPDDIPVYHIAASPGSLNTYGDLNPILAQLRPGFVGVQLIDGTHTDAYYGERGQTITFDTAAGPAQAYVIPGPVPRLNFFDRILAAVIRSALIFGQFQGNCAADPAVTPNGAESLLPGRNSTGDTALSLDEGRQTGQSVLQQCRRG